MKPKRPRDINQLAKFIVDLSVEEATEADPLEGKTVRRLRRDGAEGYAAARHGLRNSLLGGAVQLPRRLLKPGGKAERKGHKLRSTA
jgi:hypothetical protein